MIVGLIGGGLARRATTKRHGSATERRMVGGIAGSAVGGGVLMAIVGLINNAMAAKK